MSSSYKELNELRRQGGKFFRNYEKLTANEIEQMKRLNRRISLTEADLRRKEIERQNRIKQAIQDKEDSNIMNLLNRGQ
jgi:hypothetical protein